VEDRFDVVPVRVNDERCVIPGVVMRAKTRRAVVAAAGFDSGAVELVNGSSVGCGEGHMNGSGRGFPFPDPEISTALDGEPRPLRALHHLHSERLEGPLVEGAAASHVTYPQGQVIDEGKRHGQRHPLILERDPRGTFPNAGAGERGTILALLGSIERAEILIHRIDAERKSVNRQSVLARAAQKKERAQPMSDSGFSAVPAE